MRLPWAFGRKKSVPSIPASRLTGVPMTSCPVMDTRVRTKERIAWRIFWREKGKKRKERNPTSLQALATLLYQRQSSITFYTRTSRRRDVQVGTAIELSASCLTSNQKLHPTMRAANRLTSGEGVNAEALDRFRDPAPLNSLSRSKSSYANSTSGLRDVNNFFHCMLQLQRLNQYNRTLSSSIKRKSTYKIQASK